MKLAVAGSAIEAHLIVGRLEEAGIETRMEPDRSGLGEYLHAGSNPHAAVHIFVPAHAVDAARQALEEEIEQDPSELDTEEEPEVLADTGRGRAALWIAIITVLAVVMATLVANLNDIFKL